MFSTEHSTREKTTPEPTVQISFLSFRLQTLKQFQIMIQITSLLLRSKNKMMVPNAHFLRSLQPQVS